jgi:hypothetical protein
MKGVFFLYFILNVFLIQAQEIKNYTPFSISHPYKKKTSTYRLSPLNLKKIYYEDSIQYNRNRQINIARLQNIKIESVNKNKVWLSSEKAIWKVKIIASDAQ